ncbi:hypothetical protein JCM4914_67690 [Streptomyces platensis subsp. malvinus]
MEGAAGNTRMRSPFVEPVAGDDEGSWRRLPAPCAAASKSPSCGVGRGGTWRIAGRPVRRRPSDATRRSSGAHVRRAVAAAATPPRFTGRTQGTRIRGRAGRPVGGREPFGYRGTHPA